jgi:dihydrodipicolinate synthase/N-acetylneuraminate lyase
MPESTPRYLIRISKSQSTINGIFVPNIVPYDAKGSIDEDELRHIIRWVGRQGRHRILSEWQHGRVHSLELRGTP